ncbi:PIN domain-containing protein [Inhella proteolytica]|uniref:PIN-like domain-containing protein n=1 Tax=Inhella proteolytica TaxID=2795029 RepID=A0A931NGU8_9BURK|nr:PIN domain-containing protein [Inhella proteolytica]MBH9577068.1 hypothetical protein [Inhella proteolytica]
MSKKLLLVDFENKQKVDLSRLDEGFRAIIFVGASQNPPKASRKQATAHRFSRVDFLKISGAGKNALDFHIAFELGRTFETAPDTQCFVLSGDKGFDPLLKHLNGSGMQCRRVESVDELAPAPVVATGVVGQIVCPHCRKASTIPHHGGHWCSNCGRFASPPDPSLLPSNRPEFRQSEQRHRNPFTRFMDAERARLNLPVCGWCHQQTDMTGGIYDDGEWMCGWCISAHAR